MASPLIDLPQLVDLALGTPESGAVNFNILHALLHAVVQLLNAEEVRIELIGTQDAAHFGIGPSKQMMVEEYELEEKGNENSSRRLIDKSFDDFGKIVVVRKIGKDDSSAEKKVSSKSQPGFADKDIIVEKPLLQPEILSEPAKINKEKEQSFEPVAVIDSSVNKDIMKRLDNADKRFTNIENSVKDLQNKYKNISQVENLIDKVDFLERKIYEYQPDDKKIVEIKQPLQLEEKKIEEYTNRVAKPDEIKSNMETRLLKPTEDVGPKQSQTNYRSGTIIPDEVIIIKEVENLKKEVDQIKINIGKILKCESKQNKKNSLEGNKPLTARSLSACSRSKGKSVIVEEREEMDRFQELLKNLDHKLEVLSSKFMTMNDRILDIEKDLCDLVEKSEETNQGEDTKTAQISITDLHSELLNIKTIINETASQCSFLLSERNTMQNDLKILSKTVDDLSDITVNKDDIDELLAEKADFNMLQRKVSMDYFDASKRDLESTMIDTMHKMQEREQEWCKTIEGMKQHIESKLNASEITAVKEYLERRLQMLTDRMNALCAARKDPEAAGTRMKLLKNLNCISCNQHVLMRTEEIHRVAKVAPLQAHKSIKPFLTYELDNLRKQMKDFPNSRNLHHFETMFKDKGLMMDDKARQICNRYCGGSHTKISAQDRIEKGRCGKMYGARTTTAKCICAEPEPPPCTCPDEPEEPVCTCPEEPEVCSCSSNEDPYYECMSAQERRCIDIDRKRREDFNQQDLRKEKCKLDIEEKDAHLEEAKRRDKCKMEYEKREICLQKLQLIDKCPAEVDRYLEYKRVLKKYQKCEGVGQRDRNGSQTERYPSRGQVSCLDPKSARISKSESGQRRSSKDDYKRYRSTPNDNIKGKQSKNEFVRNEEDRNAITSGNKSKRGIEVNETVVPDLSDTPHGPLSEVKSVPQVDTIEQDDQKPEITQDIPDGAEDDNMAEEVTEPNAEEEATAEG